MAVHGTRYCRLNFVLIEQEMGEKFGGVAEGANVSTVASVVVACIGTRETIAI
jgi:hypothetical protein